MGASDTSLLPSAPGDLLFFKGDPKNPIDRVIMRRTGSHWVHVGVVIEHRLMLSARADGVKIEPLPNGALLYVANGSLSHREEALRWLLQQAGDGYGFGDIFNQALLWLSAHHPWFDLPTLDFARRRDCSHLVYDFLRVGGYPFGPQAHIQLLQPERVTPGMLAAALGIPDK